MSMRVIGLVFLITFLIGCVHNQPFSGTEESARELLIGQWHLEGEPTSITFNQNGAGLIETYFKPGHVTLDSELTWSVSGNQLITEPALESQDKRARETYIIHQPCGASVVLKSINGRRVLTLTEKNI
ncbi:hypothetical protein [uncultured Pseudoteredinibacter sp.]|uniref:hypothetical protein n=1 Tax=uncultured Pseudoteredinibacter sp. TaxID=1641701 RepID=UPI00262754C9|nr:hypothetical protein [uncultured Pseudoteredinibacter sp.]